MSSVLEGSYRPSIYGGTFNTITNPSDHATRPAITGMERLMEKVSPNAFYDSDNRADPPRCHENTRVAVITKIMDWVTSTIDIDVFMLWLYGPAGAGKTAIARRVAELCEAQGLLLATFLFFRSDPKRNTMNSLGANIAYCVARVIPSTNELIKIAIEADPLILTYSTEVQLTKLVLEPLRLLAEQGYFVSEKFPRLVIIDGLDECLDKGAQTKLIHFLASAMARNQLPLKFLVASRPEAHIRFAVALASEQTAFTHLELNNDFLPNEDIRRFLADEFSDIKRCHPFRSGIPSSWPREQQMDDLICKASGQFIYASLAVRFIKSACDSPMRQLDIILGLRPPINQDLPFAELDALYTFILSCTKNLDLVLDILGLNSVLQAPSGPWDSTVKIVESMLYLEDGDVRVYLSPLNSLLKISGDKIHFHHTSFTDFLHNPERSKDYSIAAAKYHSLSAQWILQVLTSTGPRHGIDQLWFRIEFMSLVHHLEHSIWTLELEHALEAFSLSTYLNWFDYDFKAADDGELWYSDFPEKFLHHLECEGKYDLYHHHLLCYMEHLNSSISNPPTREKFRLMSTVWFILQKPIASLWSSIGAARWEKLCAKLFGFDEAEIRLDHHNGYRLMRDPTTYNIAEWGSNNWDGTMYGELDATKRLVPEPILSHRVACIALSCMQYLHRQHPNNPPLQDNLLAIWATKSKRFPWLWKQRIRVTSIGRRQSTWYFYRPKYLFPDSLRRSQSLRRSHQMIYSGGIQSDDFYQERHIFYMWTLDLLYHTLRAAMKSDELTKALSQPFIPSAACYIFPRRIKRVQKAVGAYLEKFDPSSLDAPGVKRIVHRHTKPCPRRNLASDSMSSEQVPFTDRDVAEQELRRNISDILDLVYGPTEGHTETMASMRAVFNRVNELGREARIQLTDPRRN